MVGGTQLDGGQLIVLLACLWVPTVPLFLVSFSLAFTIWTLAVGMIRAASLRVRREQNPAESLQQDFDRACDLFEAKLLHHPPQSSPAAAQPTASRAWNGSSSLRSSLGGGVSGGGQAGGAAQRGLAFARCWNACISQVLTLTLALALTLTLTLSLAQP